MPDVRARPVAIDGFAPPGTIRGAPGSHLPESPLHESRTAVPHEPPDDHAAARTEKLHAIEALGLDPWGGRFDGHQPIADVLALPADLPEDQRPRVRIAGRIVSRRLGGKVHFLDVKDWSGWPTLREIKGEREGEVEQVP